MAKLSKYIREKMATALVRHRFTERAAVVVAESQELFRLCYDHHHTPEDRKHMAAILKRHPSGMKTDNSILLNVDGRRINVGEQSIAKHWRAVVMSVPTLSDMDNYPGMGFPIDSPIGARAASFADAMKALHEDVEIGQREAVGALMQFSTGKRLADDWPEAMPVIGHLIPEDDRALPVVQVSALNAKFDLPPSEKIAA